LTQNNFLAIYK